MAFLNKIFDQSRGAFAALSLFAMTALPFDEASAAEPAPSQPANTNSAPAAPLAGASRRENVPKEFVAQMRAAVSETAELSKPKRIALTVIEGQEKSYTAQDIEAALRQGLIDNKVEEQDISTKVLKPVIPVKTTQVIVAIDGSGVGKGQFVASEALNSIRLFADTQRGIKLLTNIDRPPPTLASTPAPALASSQ